MKVTQMPPVHAVNLVANSGNTAYGVDVITWTNVDLLSKISMDVCISASLHYKLFLTLQLSRNTSHSVTFIAYVEMYHYSKVKWPSWRLELLVNRVFLNYWSIESLFNSLFRLTTEKHQRSMSLSLCEGNPLVTSAFPTQRDSNMENVSIWRHHNMVGWGLRCGCCGCCGEGCGCCGVLWCGGYCDVVGVVEDWCSDQWV